MKMKFNISVNSERVEIEYSNTRKEVEVSLTGVDFDEIISEIGEQKALAQFSENAIRDYVLDNDIHI